MKTNRNSLATLVAAASLAGMMSGAAYAQTSNNGNPEFAQAGDAAPKKEAKEKHSCKGQNSCRGKGGCGSSDNGCKAKNSCKGKGGCATDGSKKH
ncbi:MAG: hypothetical protein DKT66_23410 [Candidatus Melainabacteria bacterium]|jgi:hypothetical protein|nr:MAG: hypothetical protein DKT66_23410 [Candidatus Melainabacteria bacterium]